MLYLNFFFLYRNQNCFSVKLKPFHVFTKTNRKQVRAERILAGKAQRSAYGFSCELLQLMGSILLLVMSVQVLLFPSKKAGTGTYGVTVFLREASARCAKVVFW